VKDSGKIAASANASRHLSGFLFILVAPGDGAFTSVLRTAIFDTGVVYGAGLRPISDTVGAVVMVAASVVACLLLALISFDQI